MFNKIIEDYSFLKNLDENTKYIIINSLITKKFDMGYTLIKEGQACAGFSLILSGEIRVFKISEKGREVTLYKLSKGDTCYLSMSCLISDELYPAYAEVTNPVEIAFIPTSIFNKYIYNTIDFQKYLFENLYSKFNSVLNVLEEVAFLNIDTRIAKYFINISKEANNTKFLYLTHEKIAKEVGTSREVVSRMLTNFKNKDIISIQRGKITVLYFKKLNSIANL